MPLRARACLTRSASSLRGSGALFLRMLLWRGVFDLRDFFPLAFFMSLDRTRYLAIAQYNAPASECGTTPEITIHQQLLASGIIVHV